MKKFFYASFFYAVIGVLSGLFYREFSKANNFGGKHSCPCHIPTC
ncbi:MAG TPA: DUF2871 family protein [Micrococcaceae bacterium]|nr:DUF2871 family protein [Micrococcaceae bacterium]